MLDLQKVDLSALVLALEDHSPETTWLLDPRTGEVEPDSSFDTGEDEEHPEDRGMIRIEPIASGEAYRDMEDFIARVRDPRGRDLLERAVGGRGAFRRFKDTLIEFPEIRSSWFAFHDARMERRAIEWLADEGLIDPRVAEEETAARGEQSDLPGMGDGFDPNEIAGRVADDLRALYGARLRSVLLFGSWARGDAHPESDIDLLVVLDRVDSPWEELRRMDETLWRHSVDNDTVVSALPVTEGDLDEGRDPVIVRARAEGRRVA